MSTDDEQPERSDEPEATPADASADSEATPADASAGTAPSEASAAEAETGPVSEGESPRADASADAPSEEPVAEEPTSEEPVEEPAQEPAKEPVVEEPAEEPVAEKPADAPPQEPVDEETKQEPVEATAASEEGSAPDAEAEPVGAADAATRVQEPSPAEAGDTSVAESAAPTGDEERAEEPKREEVLEPRARPEIPGADLEPDLIAESDQYLDAEAQAAAEAEAEEARARAEAEDEQAKPIADAAIDLAAGARYTATGKRKTAVARVILKPGNGSYAINGKELEAVFPRSTLQRMIRQPLETVGYDARMDVIARMHGGGVAAQAGALRHGISRALIVADPNLRGELKRRGFLTRDPRVKERKKAGLKKARKRPQFSKR